MQKPSTFYGKIQFDHPVVLDVLEPLAKLPPLFLGPLRLEVRLLERAHLQVREALPELGVDVVVARTQPRDLLRVHGAQDLKQGGQVYHCGLRLDYVGFNSGAPLCFPFAITNSAICTNFTYLNLKVGRETFWESKTRSSKTHLSFNFQYLITLLLLT